MSYQCKDCSYTKKAPFPDGCCPACGSYNVHRQGENSEHAKQQGKLWRLWTSIALWILLGYLVYQKL